MITITKEELYFKGSNILPEIYFKKEGKLKIQGKIIPDSISSFFVPLHYWINELRCSSVTFDINIECMNPNALQELFHLIRTLAENTSIQQIVVLWHYKEKDDENYEMGKLFATQFENIKFIYISHTNELIETPFLEYFKVEEL
jgi:hypothetical protein